MPEPLRALAPATFHALTRGPLPRGPLAFDPGPPLALGPLPLQALALQPLRERLAPAAELDYLGVTRAEATGGCPLGLRSLIGDAIVPRKPHAAG